MSVFTKFPILSKILENLDDPLLTQVRRKLSTALSGQLVKRPEITILQIVLSKCPWLCSIVLQKIKTLPEPVRVEAWKTYTNQPVTMCLSDFLTHLALKTFQPQSQRKLFGYFAQFEDLQLEIVSVLKQPLTGSEIHLQISSLRVTNALIDKFGAENVIPRFRNPNQTLPFALQYAHVLKPSQVQDLFDYFSTPDYTKDNPIADIHRKLNQLCQIFPIPQDPQLRHKVINTYFTPATTYTSTWLKRRLKSLPAVTLEEVVTTHPLWAKLPEIKREIPNFPLEAQTQLAWQFLNCQHDESFHADYPTQTTQLLKRLCVEGLEYLHPQELHWITQRTKLRKVQRYLTKNSHLLISLPWENTAKTLNSCISLGLEIPTLEQILDTRTKSGNPRQIPPERIELLRAFLEKAGATKQLQIPLEESFQSKLELG